MIVDLDLTDAEKDHVRQALHVARAKFRSWATLAKVLGYDESTIRHAAAGNVKSDGRRFSVSPALTFRLARLLDVKLDDLITGRCVVPGMCPRCGFVLPAHDDASGLLKT